MAIRRVVRRFLERSGWVVDEAPSAAVAAELLFAAERPYGLVLCDLNLPDGSGLDLVHAVEVERPELAPWCVLSTGEAAGGSGTLSEAEARRLGSRGRLLTKPFSLEELARLVGGESAAAAAAA